MRPRNAPQFVCLLGLIASQAAVYACDLSPASGTPHGAVLAEPRAAASQATLPNFATVAEQNVATLVSITTEQHRDPARDATPDNDRASVERGFGTGVIVSADGKILTNDHVLATASDADISVELADGTRHKIRTIYRDERYDLALVQLDPPRSGMRAATFEETSPRPGEWVMAMGHPRALGNTVTVGVISGLGRTHREIGAPADLLPGGVWHFLQTDVSINPGSSGGPLFNARGNVVGLNTAVLRGSRGELEGIAFAIPCPLLLHFMDEISAHGRVRHPSLGMVVDGVRVISVDSTSPAARAALRADDVILAVKGVPVRRYQDLLYELEIAGMDAPIQLTIAREGQPAMTLEILPEERT